MIATGHGPTAIASGLGDLWVTDSFENTVSRIDESGVRQRHDPRSVMAPSAIAVGEGAVWVVDSLDDTVVRIDPVTNSRDDHDPGRPLPEQRRRRSRLGLGREQARRHGLPHRSDDERACVETIDVGDSPAGLVVAAGSVWVTNQEACRSRVATTRRGKRRRCASARPATFETDPALYTDPQINYATCAKLLNYPDAPAPRRHAARSRGRRLATDPLPRRKDVHVHDPRRLRLLTAATRARDRRDLQVRDRAQPAPEDGSGGTSFLSDIAGVDAYRSGKAAHISGIVVDGNTPLDHARRARPRLPGPARDARSPAPCLSNAPIDPKGVQAIPSAGPYYIAEYSPNHRIVLKRNPNYHGVASPPFSRDPLRARRRSRERRRRRPRRDDRTTSPTIPPVEGDAALLARYGPASDAARNGRQQYFINPDAQARLPRAEHEPAAVLGPAPAEGRQLRDRPPRARPDRELGLRSVPVHPHRPVPATDDAWCEPNRPLSAERRPAHGAAARPGRARHGRPLHLRRLPAAVPPTRTTDQGEPGRARARRRHPRVPHRRALRARRNQRGAVRPHRRHTMASRLRRPG